MLIANSNNTDKFGRFRHI